MSNLSPHFSRGEFACKCGCGWANPHPHLVSQLEMLRAWANLEPNFELSISITSGGRCPRHHWEVTRCKCLKPRAECKTSDRYWEVKYLPDYGVNPRCSICHGTGSTSPESYHLPRIDDPMKFGKINLACDEFDGAPEYRKFMFSLAADFQIMRRMFAPPGDVHPTSPTLDLAAMQAMNESWEPIWPGGWCLYDGWIHCDPGPRRRW